MTDEFAAVVAERDALRAALQNIRGEAKVLRNARNLVGPAEYADKPHLAKVWWKTCYSIGKQFDKMCQTALAKNA